MTQACQSMHISVCLDTVERPPVSDSHCAYILVAAGISPRALKHYENNISEYFKYYYGKPNAIV